MCFRHKSAHRNACDCFSDTDLLTVLVKRAGVGWHVPKAMMLFENVNERWAKCLYAIYLFWAFATAIPRIAVVCLYLRIFHSRRMRVATWIVLSVIVAAMCANIFAGIFACWPVQYAWDKSIAGKCFNIPLWFRLSPVPVIVTDIPLLILPIPQVLALEMTPLKKTGVILTFMTGSL